MMRIAILLLVCSTAYADNELSLGGGSRALRSSSADAVTGDSLGIGGLGYARRLAIDAAPVALWAEAGFGWGDADGDMFETMSTQIRTYAVTAGVRASYPLHRLIDATARIDVGTARTSLAVSEGMAKVSDSGWGALAQGALGADLFASRSPVFSLGMRLELGYTQATGIGLTPRPDSQADTLKLATAEASIGHLDLSGPFFAISALAQF
jgi:hypothetical protein